MPPDRIFAPLVAFFLLLAGAGLQARASETPKLIFRKTVPAGERQKAKPYTVKQGEYIYSIMRSFKVAPKKMPLLMERIKELNPQIENFNEIYPGQTLYLPPSLLQGEEKPSRQSKKRTPSAVPEDLQKVPTLEYRVQPGDRVVELLRRLADLPESLIFDEYLTLFRRLNPHVDNINRLEVGQRVDLPLRPGKRDGSAAAAEGTNEGSRSSGGAPASAPDAQEPEQEAEPASRERGKRDLVLDLLRRAGFKRSNGNEILYPLERGGWLRIDLKRTPMLEPPWEGSILLVPEDHNQEIRLFKQTGLDICRVQPDWEPSQVFRQLEKTSQRGFTYWGPGENLILNFPGLVIEMQAGYQLIINNGPSKEYHVFFDPGRESLHHLSLLSGFLKTQGIHLHRYRPEASPAEVTAIHPPDAQGLYVPEIDFQGLWDLFTRELPQQRLPSPPVDTSSKALLPYLKSQGLVSSETLRLAWSARPEFKLRISLQAASLELSKTSYLLPSEIRDPHLIALLNARGFTCFALQP